MTQLVLPSLRLDAASSYQTLTKSPTSKQHGRNLSKPSAVEPLARVIKGLGGLVLSLRDGLTEEQRRAKKFLEERKQILAARLQDAETYVQWEKAAHELDILEGNEEWKADVTTGDYNPDVIKARLEELDEARNSGDLRAMKYLVRTALSRDLGGMGNIDLYRHSYCGTKKLIERYVDSTLKTISALVDQSERSLPDDLEAKDFLDAVLFARQSFGRSALLLSGGGTFGMAHIGVLKAMFQAKLLPRIISGASAGSIVCAVACTKTDEEIPLVLDEFPNGDLSVFDEEGSELGLLDHLRRMLIKGSWSDIKHLTRVMRDLLDDITFQEAYNRTRRICNICVSSPSIYELPRLLNYVTAPNVMIWSAVAASCSVPIVFTAAPLLVKDPITGEHSRWDPTPQTWIDGSVDNDLPMTRLAEMFNVNHFIVSQVNPHVVPFLAKEDSVPSPSSNPPVSKDEGDWISTITQLAKGEALHRMQFLAEMGIFPNLVTKLRSILSQKYSGDINILPAIGALDLPRILSNPTTEFMLRSCALGERATWPKISRIRDSCAIELALDRAVHSLRDRVVFSQSQVDLRRMETGSLAGNFRRIVPGSHEPLNALDTYGGPTRISPKDKLLKQRQRRMSASHLQHFPHHRRLADDPYKVTDGDTDDEERLEMSYRRPHSKPKMKFKRHFRNHPLQTGPLTTTALPSSSNEPDGFDFGRPVTPAHTQTGQLEIGLGSPGTLMPPAVHKAHFDDSLNYAGGDTASMTSPAEYATHVNEMETSDLHSSDADVDSHSDESAADPPVESSDLESDVVEEAWLHDTDSEQHSSKSASPQAWRRQSSAGSPTRGVDPGAGLWD